MAKAAPRPLTLLRSAASSQQRWTLSTRSRRPGPCSCAWAVAPSSQWMFFLGSFSAVSKRNLATKYAFFQVFRDLQNYLAKFSKKLQNFAKNQRFSQKSALFLQKSGNFAKSLKLLRSFWKILQLFQKIS